MSRFFIVLLLLCASVGVSCQKESSPKPTATAPDLAQAAPDAAQAASAKTPDAAQATSAKTSDAAQAAPSKPHAPPSAATLTNHTSDHLPHVEAPTTIDSATLTRSASGLAYVDLIPGNGPQPSPGDLIFVYHTGWLANGDRFESSMVEEGGATTFGFVLGQDTVIKGWNEGIETMRLGGKRMLIVPPALAYGAEGEAPSIPPDATLTYEITLADIQRVPSNISLPATDKPTEVDPKKLTTLPTGLRYADLETGQGAQPEAGSQLVVHYTGWIEGGERFHTSLERSKPTVFELGADHILDGWNIGLADMRIGGKRLLIIPPELGYGKEGLLPAIPPDATLIFEVTLLGVR